MEMVNSSTVEIKDFICSNIPNLILVADKPLARDKREIFDSPKGMEYLRTCFRSKFKAVNTYVTWVEKTENINYFNDVHFPKLFKTMFKQDTNLSQVLVAFIGKKAFEKALESRDNSRDVAAGLWMRENYSSIRTSYTIGNKLVSKDIPYIILPDLDEDFSNIPEILNESTIGKSVTDAIYSSTEDLIKYLNEALEQHKRGNITGLVFDAVIREGDKKVEYTQFYDYYSRRNLKYNINDEICANDSKELKQVYKDVFTKAFTTIPIAMRCSQDVLRPLKFFSEITFKTEEEIRPVNPDLVLDRPDFRITGDSSGNESEWYTKWKTETYPKICKNISTTRDMVDYSLTDKKKYEWIYDIEVFKEDWLFVAKSLDGKSKVVCWNDAPNLCNWIRDKILIGFNNAAYDDNVIRYAMQRAYAVDKELTVKQYSDALIEDNKPEAFITIQDKFKNVLIPKFLSWDINFHMPFDIRRNSLKKLTMSVLNKRNYDSSVPFDIDRALTPEERKEVELYCELDVDNTRELFLPDPKDIEAQKENPKHKMRDFARDSYDIKWNLIVEYNLQCKTLINKAASFAGKLLCGEDAKPDLRNTKKNVNGKEVYYSIPELALKELAGTPLLQFYLDNQSNPEYIHEKFEYYMGGNDDGHLYQFGFGGLHQALLCYGSENLVNMDVASLYPSLLVQYKLMSRGAGKNPDSYEEVYHTRLKAKREGKKLLNEGLKLILNGSIGAMLSEFNPLYDTWSNSTICVHGQLFLFILCKRLYDAGFNIVQTNTDGIMIERQADVDFMPICEQWMKETRLVLEFDEIAILQQNNVNNYYCQFTNGKVKSKGFYLSNEKFGKATSKILCNIVTKKPPLEGTEPRDFVIFKRHSIGEIYDGVTNTKLEGRSLAFVVGHENDTRTQSYYSRSKNVRKVVKKDERGKSMKDEMGNLIMEDTNSISKITGFTDHMLLVDDINTLTMEEIRTQEYINFAKNLLNKHEDFGPYYTDGFLKSEEPAFLQALNSLKDNTDPFPTNSGVVCQNFLFECDYMTKEEQEELIQQIEPYTYRIVWSGNRSYHIVLRLDRPTTSIRYKNIWYYLQNKLGLHGADTQSNVPSKYTRVPGQINPKTGNMQELYSQKGYIFSLDEIMENLPKLDVNKDTQATTYKGKISMQSLERHVNRQDWQDGNRFAACQKLSPVLISLVPLKKLIEMIPVKLDKDHINVLRAKYYYFEKYSDLLVKEEDKDLFNWSGE